MNNKSNNNRDPRHIELIEPMEFFDKPEQPTPVENEIIRPLVEPMILFPPGTPAEVIRNADVDYYPDSIPSEPVKPSVPTAPPKQQEDPFASPFPEMICEPTHPTQLVTPDAPSVLAPPSPTSTAIAPYIPAPSCSIFPATQGLSLAQRFELYDANLNPASIKPPSGNSNRKKGSGDYTPYGLMRWLIHNFTLCVREKDVYLYIGNHYQKTDQQGIQYLIMHNRRDIIETSGDSTLAKKAYELLLMEPEIAVPDIALNRDYVPFQNGLLRLCDGSLSAHTPVVFTTYVLNCNYSPSAPPDCPHFDQYLRTATGNDPVLTARIWEMIGYCLTPDTAGKVLFVLQGVPNSGKSLLSDLLRSFFPPEKVSAQDVHNFGRQFCLSELKDRALNISPDLSADILDSTSVSNIKKLTGNDLVAADKKYASYQQYRFEGKLILATNYPLLTKTYDEAFIQRIVAIPFLFSIPRENRDPALLSKLVQERNAIATKAIAFYFLLRQRGYRFSGEYELNSDTILASSNLDASADSGASVFSFVKTNFEKDPCSMVETSEAYNLFCSTFHRISMKEFSALFTRFAAEQFGATKGRSRCSTHQNARSCICGIRQISF